MRIGAFKIFSEQVPKLSWQYDAWRKRGLGLLFLSILFLEAGVAAENKTAAHQNPEPEVLAKEDRRSASFNLTSTPSTIGRGLREINQSFDFADGKNILPVQKAEDGRFQIGVILPLSGEFSELGQDFLNAIILALFDMNDDNLTLLISDSKGTNQGASYAAVDVISRGADVILGPIFDYTIAPASSISRQVKIPLIGFSANRHVVEEGVYLLNFSPEQQVDRIVEFASQHQIERFAALIPEGSYGSLMESSFRSAVGKYGGEMIQIVYYSSDFDSLKLAAEELSTSDLGQEGDAVFIPEGGNMLISLASFLTYYDIDPTIVRLLGTGLWDDPKLCREPSLRQGWFASPSHPVDRDFKQKFEDYYGHMPPRIVELGYDALLVGAMLQKQEETPYQKASILVRDGGFTGINGLFRFQPNGLSERGLSIFEIGKDKIKEIGPAANSFQ